MKSRYVVELSVNERWMLNKLQSLSIATLLQQGSELYQFLVVFNQAIGCYADLQQYVFAQHV